MECVNAFHSCQLIFSIWSCYITGASQPREFIVCLIIMKDATFPAMVYGLLSYPIYGVRKKGKTRYHTIRTEHIELPTYKYGKKYHMVMLHHRCISTMSIHCLFDNNEGCNISRNGIWVTVLPYIWCQEKKEKLDTT